jgi:hypothetical protein
VVDLLVGDADDDEVVDGELGVADAVLDEGDRAAVDVPAVGFDDRAVLGPVEVGDVAADRVLFDRPGQRASTSAARKRRSRPERVGARPARRLRTAAPGPLLALSCSGVTWRRTSVSLRAVRRCGEPVAARSWRVRATVVTGSPCRVVSSSVEALWKMRSWRLRGGRRPVTLTSTNGGIEGISLCSAVPVLWLSALSCRATSSAA